MVSYTFLVVKSKCGGAWFGKPLFSIFPSEILLIFSTFIVTQPLVPVIQERKTGLPSVYPAGTVFTTRTAPGFRLRPTGTCRDLFTSPSLLKVHCILRQSLSASVTSALSAYFLVCSFVLP